MNFSITDLKKHLGPGLGLRKNKYLLEIPLPGTTSEKINVLARSAGLPERSITTASLFHKGRQYNVRGETDYGTTYEVSIVDDSAMSIREKFDRWLKIVDDSKQQNNGVLSGASYETGTSDIIDAIKSGVGVANKVKTAVRNPSLIGNYIEGAIDSGHQIASSLYQTDINIWQLDAVGNKIYGYKLQNAFPSQIGIVTLDDGDANTLSEFSVNFTFSEFMPLKGIPVTDNIVNALIGDNPQDIISGIQSLFR